jgi:hypothetical protein
MALFLTAKDAIITLLDVLVKVDGEEEEQGVVIGVVKALLSMRPALGSLTKIRRLLQTADDGLYADGWGDFLATRDRLAANELGAWVAIVDRAVSNFALEASSSHDEHKAGGDAPARSHFVRPKVTVTLPTWSSTPGDCGEFFTKISDLLKQMLVPETQWYHMILQQITGSARLDWENSLTGGVEAGEALSNWIKKLVDMYDVDAEFQLLKESRSLDRRRASRYFELRSRGSPNDSPSTAGSSLKNTMFFGLPLL